MSFAFEGPPILETIMTNSRSPVYINLPIGGAAMIFILFILKVPDRETTRLPMRQKLAQLDPFGLALLLPGVICLLLALQWGGLEYPWYLLSPTHPLHQCGSSSLTYRKAQRSHHRPSHTCWCSPDRIHRDPDPQAQDRNHRAAHLLPKEHHGWLRGHLLYRVFDDDHGLLPADILCQ